jgi:hypothetical protein
MARVSTDGCSELTCLYHGESNRRKLEALKRERNEYRWPELTPDQLLAIARGVGK